MEYAQIQDLRDELRFYLKNIRTNICSGKQKRFYYAPLHQVIDDFDIDEVPGFLAKINVNSTSIIPTIRFLDALLMDSLSLIRDEYLHLCKIDKHVYEIFDFCEELHIRLLMEIQKLEERRSTDIIESDKYLLKHILEIADDKTQLVDYINLHTRGISSIKAHRVLSYAISEIEKKTDLPNKDFILEKLITVLENVF